MIRRKQLKLFLIRPIEFLFLIILLFSFTSYRPQVDAKTEKLENTDINKIATQAPLPTSPAFNINSLDFSPERINGTGYVPFNKVKDFYNQSLVYPMNLVNQVGKALYMNDVPSFMTQLNDSSLEISMSDFSIERRTRQYDGSKLDYNEVLFYEALDSGSGSYIIYRFDGDLDGKEEIYMYENLINTDAGIMSFYILEPNENGKYQYSYGSYFDSRKDIAAFKYEGQYYFLFNHEDYLTHTTCSLELAQVSERINNYKSKNHLLTDVFLSIYLNLDQQKGNYSLVYKNSDCNLTGNVVEYVNRIKTDLLQSNASAYGLFYGYEKEVTNNFIYSADVNNDGTDELFDRGFYGQDNSLKINWYKDPPNGLDANTGTASPPFTLQSPDNYFLKQMWFIPMDGKTITFRLFQNNNNLRFVLDACLYENKTETHIAVYKVEYYPNVVFAPYWEAEPLDNIPEVKLADPDHDKALGMFSDKNYSELLEKYSCEINKIKYDSDNFPSDIVSKIQDGLISSGLEKVSVGMQEGIKTLSEDKFLDETAAYFDKETWQYIDTYNQFDCYKADIDGDGKNEYIVFTSDGSAGYAQFNIYKLKNRKMENILSQEGMFRGFNSLIHYGSNFYYIASTMDYNSKETNGAIVFRIFPDGQDKALLINLQTDNYKAYLNYSNNDDISLQIDSYIKSIEDKLLPQNNDFSNYEEFVGDENTNLSIEEKSRLYSIGGRGTYYKVDYNNNGIDEYFTKYFSYPSMMSGAIYLSTKFFKLGDSVESFAPDFGADGALYQLWYKSFGGKFYTFRLLNIGELYVVNVSLLEGNTIHQVYTYTLYPQKSLHIEEVDSKKLGPKG